MMKKATNIFLPGVLALSVTLFGCGGGSSSEQKNSGSSSETVSGTVTTDAPITGSVSLKDSSSPAQERTTTTSSNGSYSFNTSGLTAPYVLKATWTDASGSRQMYSLAEQSGRTNINPISDAAVIASSDNEDADGLYNSPSRERYERSKINFRAIIDQLRVVLAPLFALYQTIDPVTDDDSDHNGERDSEHQSEGSGSWLQAMFKDVSFVARSGKLTVTNRSTGGVIYEAPLNNITSGVFHSENLPNGAPGPVDGAALYAASCASCHGPLATSSKKNTTAAKIQAAIDAGTGGMGSLSNLTALQVQAIATALTSTTTPAACTYTYAAWGACQSNNAQSRTVVSSSPAGCTGTPVLSQSCAYVPPVTTCTSFTYSAWGSCQSNNTQTRTVTSSSPAGCTGGSPVLSQACVYIPPVTTCTSFTYSAWGACQSNNTQSRTVASSSPAGCTGGSPVLSQACTYVPPVTTCTSFTYSAWGACQSNNTQTRTVASSSPAGCTGGTPVLSQSCTYVPPIDGAALYTQYCSGCHGNGKKGKSATAIQNAINNNTGGMGSTALRALTSAQIAAISAAP